MIPLSRRAYVAALDLGTISSRCIIFDRTGSPIGVAQREHRQIRPQPGWVEHDPIEILARVDEIVAGALAVAGISAHELAAVGITNQRETTIVWDRATGQPVCNCQWPVKPPLRYQQRPIKASGVDAARRAAGTARNDSLADQDEDGGKSALDTATAEGEV